MAVFRRSILLGMFSLWATAAPVRSAPAPGITEVSLTRTTCFGTCPAYELVLRSDGTATFRGGLHSQRQGAWSGKFSAKDFADLALLADQVGYFSFRDVYERLVSDNPWTISSVVRDGKRKTVMNYAEAGPLALAAFEAAIDLSGRRVKWSQP